MPATAPETLPSDLRQLSSRRPESPVPFVQGTYYLLIGLWPVLAIDSLLSGSVAGAEPWQLRAFGVAVALVGAAMLAAARRSDRCEMLRLGVAVALGLAAADVILVLNGTAPPIYLADAAVQVAFVFWWGRHLVPHDPELVGTLRTGLT
jgi:hypothetical protein